MGLMKESIAFWTPVILINYGLKSGSALSAVIPLCALAGIFLSVFFMKMFKKSYVKMIILSFICSLAAGCSMLLLDDLASAIISLAIILASMYALNTLLLSYYPMRFKKYNAVSGIIGFSDFCSYMGAGVSTFLLGFIYDSGKWFLAPLLWCVLSLTAVIFALLRFKGRGEREDENSI